MRAQLFDDERSRAEADRGDGVPVPDVHRGAAEGGRPVQPHPLDAAGQAYLRALARLDPLNPWHAR